jgi:hypothetical protein
MLTKVKKNGEAEMSFTTADGLSTFTTTFIALAGGVMDEFWQMMNVRDPAPYLPPQVMEDVFLFKNVWNRRDLYFHASFVNHTAFNYLGKAGDFYMEPNKLYKADGITQEFFLEMSLDGMTPVDLPFEDFDVELSLIVDTESVLSF